MKRKIIRATTLTKVFGSDVEAIDDKNFEVKEGEIFGFLCPNGVGKTATKNA